MPEWKKFAETMDRVCTVAHIRSDIPIDTSAMAKLVIKMYCPLNWDLRSLRTAIPDIGNRPWINTVRD